MDEIILKQCVIDLIVGYQPNVFMTLRPNVEGGTSYVQMVKAFGAFAHTVKNKLFGRNSRKRLFLFPVVEKFGSGYAYDSLCKPSEAIHIHCMATLPGDPREYEPLVRDTWLNASPISGDPYVYCPTNDKWFVSLSTEAEARIYASYIVKGCQGDTLPILWKYVPAGLIQS